MTKTAQKPPTPEHGKITAISSEELAAVRRFAEWLVERDIYVDYPTRKGCRPEVRSGTVWDSRDMEGVVESTLAQYYGVDLSALRAKKEESDDEDAQRPAADAGA